MDLLIVGGGGREHALAWKLRQSPRVGRLFVAPGNGGIASMAGVECAPIAADDVASLCNFAHERGVGLTIVGPEAPLAAGIVDRFQAEGLRIFGPTQAAARLETSKAFAKQFMRRFGIPTAQAEEFTTVGPALEYLRSLDAPPVVKASGLAAGKGVIVAQSIDQAEAAVRAMLVDREFGEAGATVLIEERLEGPELSVLAFCDGHSATLMPGAQDHKRLLDGDQGPNTGGMGAFAPSALDTAALRFSMLLDVFRPVLTGMAEQGTPYFGVLYAGMILTPSGPRVLEFNCRLGDPEAQVILPLMRSDLVEVAEEWLEGNPNDLTIDWEPQSAVSVVLAAGGYPGTIETGRVIHGLAEAESTGCLVFHAGTRAHDRDIVTSGGRVLSVTGVAATRAEAAERAYAGVERIHFEGAQYRRDIARPIRR